MSDNFPPLKVTTYCIQVNVMFCLRWMEHVRSRQHKRFCGSWKSEWGWNLGGTDDEVEHWVDGYQMTSCPLTSSQVIHQVSGSFRVKSPKITENLNPTVSDFIETWYTCCLAIHSPKSKILGQSGQWCGRYGPPNFESFGKNGRGCQPLNPHISGKSDQIFIKLVLMDRQFDTNSKYM